MLNFVCCRRCSSVGTALAGTLPGSVRLVLACVASASEDSTPYTTEAQTGMPPVCAKNVMVSAEYPIKNQTRQLIMVPAGSDWFIHTPWSSDVPTLQE